MTDVKAVAEKLVSYCREGKEDQGLDEYYADNAVSVEAMAGPGMENRETHGLAGIKGKHEWWNNAMEVHSAEVEGPFMHGDDKFGVIFAMDVTEKESGNRQQMRELAVYTVEGGKVVREEFFYNM